MVSCSLVFFFFQAEDGIRDWSVTGVQTCALPISQPPRPAAGPAATVPRPAPAAAAKPAAKVAGRSEERRVGKECRSRWGGYLLIKNIAAEREHVSDTNHYAIGIGSCIRAVMHEQR